MDLKRKISAGFARWGRGQKPLAMEPSEAVAPNGPNSRVWSAVEAFVSRDDSPQYALLIDGPWGVGKTHFQKALKTHFEAEKVWLYVSVYGLSSKAEIDKAVFAALYPQLSGNAAKVVGAFARAALSAGKLNFPLDPTTLLDRKSIDVIVFDDLERSSLPPGELLGYINSFVEHEHDGLKVILLANVDAMEQSEAFEKTREKVIGRSVRLKPDIDAAFPTFAASVSESARDVILGAADRFKDRFTESGTDNMRLLHQAVWDSGRIADAMSQEQRENADLVHAIFDLIVILAVELRSRAIEEEDLFERRKRWIRGQAGDANALHTVAKKYPSASLLETPLSDDTLRSLFIDGVVDPDAVRADLDRSRWMHVEREASWTIAWRSHELPDEMVERAIDEMNESWDKRQYVEYGEILHVFGIRLWLSEIGRIEQDVTGIEAEGRLYIDEVRDAGRLPAADRGAFRHTSGHGGLGYMKVDTDPFRRFAVYLQEQQVEGDRRRRPGQAQDLLAELKTDPELFGKRIANTGGSEAIWAMTPILHHLDVKELVDWLVEQHPALQRDVLMSISIRYDYGRLEQELAEERFWLESLRRALRRRAKAATPVARDRILNNIKWLITPRLEGREPN